MALASLLSIARSALLTQQRAMAVTSQNIANAGNPEYTRQRAVIETLAPQRKPYGSVGSGVTIGSLERLRDEFLDLRYRDEQSLGGRFEALNKHLAQVEQLFGEPSDTGLGAGLDAFWAAWSDMAIDPASGASRTLVRQAGRTLANTLNSLDSRIKNVGVQTVREVESAVTEINFLAAEIAALNVKVVEAEAGGARGSAGDLRDRRDAALDRIGELLPMRVVENDNGSIRVMVSEVLLVDQSVAQRLVTRANVTGRAGLGLEAGTNFFEPAAGELSGLLSTINDGISSVTAQLDQLAAVLVDQVNIMHRSGMGRNGSTGVDFFDPAQVNAGSIRLSTAVENSTDAIAGGTTGTAGDGALALQIAGFRSLSVAALDGLSFNGFYTKLVTGLGADVQNARRVADAQQVLTASLQGQRDAAHGVSIDEEMVNLIMHQQAYAAAARIVSVADEMVLTLLNMF